MTKKLKLKENATIFGLIFTIAAAVFIIALSIPFFTEARLKDSLFDAGVDSIGALFSAALFFGCMKQNGNGIGYLRSLIVLVSVCFAVNEAILFTVKIPEQSTVCFILCLISKLLDLAMIYLFYSYVKVTLGFNGKIARLAEKIIPVLLALETLVLLS
ncbi:MAG: hypothetical protein IJU20_03370, partial [Clostridia bacterium]|nr:hypothetical protein [Clostridia bacterium]